MLDVGWRGIVERRKKEGGEGKGEENKERGKE